MFLNATFKLYFCSFFIHLQNELKVPKHRWEGFLFSYLFESIVNAVKMKHKLSFTETLHYSLYEFFNRFNCLFCLVFMFLSLVASRSGNVLLGFRMRCWISLYHWGKRLCPSGTQTLLQTK